MSMSNAKRTVVFLALCVILGVMQATGCLLPLDPSGGTGGNSSSGSGVGGSPSDELAGADPAQLALVKLKAEYTAYTIEGMIEQNVTDPNSVDDSTLQMLADQFAPDAGAAAEQWILSLDPSTIPLWSPDPDQMAICADKFGCELTEQCTFSGGAANCWLASCGEGKCPACPNIFDLNKLLVKGWCAHVCLGKGITPTPIVGYKIVIHFRGGSQWRYCYEVANKP